MLYLHIFIIFSSFLLPLSSNAAVDSSLSPALENQSHPPHVRGEVLVKIDADHSLDALARIENEQGLLHIDTFALVPGLRLYQFNPSRDVFDVIRSFQAHSAVVYAEPNFLYNAFADDPAVNDPEYPKQWSLENLGQTSGKIDADINAEPMWLKQRGSRNIVVGIIDTGIDYTHPDLVDNLWTNLNEIKDNGVDDDQNGYIDDIHGVNTIKKTGKPLDDNAHGTHVAGTIGAVGNNNLGVVGVAQAVQLAACKFLSSGGSGTTSNAIKCMEYFVSLKTRAENPVNIVATNNSWGGGGSSQALLDAIKAHNRLGILFIAAAGNEKNDNDVNNTYPASYDVPNVVAVAATDHLDRLASFSNYGKNKVHVAAPGVKILSTILNRKYGELSGTSMAAPHVTGLSAIIAAEYPNLDHLGIKNLVVTSGQKIEAVANKTVSGRRIRGADVDGVGALTCENQIIVARKSPAGATIAVELGNSLFLSAHHLNCASFGGPLTVYEDASASVVLEDNGETGDILAHDGIYSLEWKPSAVGEYQLKFSDTDIVTVTVENKSGPAPLAVNDAPWSKSIRGHHVESVE